MDINAAGGSNAGLDEAKLDDLEGYAESDRFSEAERAALALADATCATPVRVSDALFARLRQCYDDEELVELAGTIAVEQFRSRFNRVFEVEAQGLYCRVPQATNAQQG